METNANLTVMKRLLEPVGRCMTVDFARRLSALGVDDDLQNRFDELADKNTQGTLTTAERAEYESYVHGLTFVGVLQSQARSLLNSSANG